MLQALFPVAAIRRVEKTLGASLPPGTLMARAGAAVAEHALSMALERAGPMLIVAGPGNNGGDALVAARVLHQRGIAVHVALLETPERYRGDACDAWHAWLACDGASLTSTDESAFHAALGKATLVIDGLFGIGLKSGTGHALPQRALRWIAAVNAAQVASMPVLAIDVPSGLDTDTGTLMDIAIHATQTLSFIAAKPGLYTGDGPDYCGSITIDPLGYIASMDDQGEIGYLNAPELFIQITNAPRLRNSHKGQFGSLGICGGGDGMVGAALLAARMGLHAGAGRVYLQLLASAAPTCDVLQPELMLRQRLEDVALDALVAGPGMGHNIEALLAEILQRPTALVLDADALNAIAATPTLGAALHGRAARGLMTILTPHPLEAARLLGIAVTAVQADRVAAARQLVERYRCTVVLKGAGTVIADLVEAASMDTLRWAINPTGNPALATGGTGDVLAGLIGALLARAMAGEPRPEAIAWNSALAAVWLHGSAADHLVAESAGPVGITASELIPAIRLRLNALGRSL